MSLNVNPDVEDVYYRYKMPKLNVKVEGKGNGIKTVVTNMSEIAKSIYRKPSYPIKYFGIELGSQTNIDDKNEKYVVNGAHDGTKLQETLYTFIKKFVLCSKCGNPETTLTIKKKSEKVTTKCKACGELGSLDMKHKLTPYIIKNPPETEADGAPPPKTAEEIDEIKQQEFSTADSFGEMTINSTKPLSETTKTVKNDNDVFFETITEKFRNGTLLDERKKVLNLCKKLKLKESSIMILMEAVFVTVRTLLADIEKYRKLFQLFTRVGPTREKYQNYVITGIILLCEKFNIHKYAVHLLKAFYDNDIIEEDVILEWHEKGPNKKFCSKQHSREILDSCVPMIDWLKDAAEESGPDDFGNDENEDRNEHRRTKNGGSVMRSNQIMDSTGFRVTDNVDYDPNELIDIDDI